MAKGQRRSLGFQTGPYWCIEGFDSTRRIYRREILAHHLGTNQVRPLLQALAARAGLDFDEIVGAYASRRAPIRNELLEVTRDPLLRFSCGTNPFFNAVFVRRQDARSIKPTPDPAADEPLDKSRS